MFSFSPRAKALLLALGIFILGIACGSMAERWSRGPRRPIWGAIFSSQRPSRGNRGGPPSAERIVQRMKKELELKDEQVDQIQSILEASRTSASKLRESIRDEMRSIESTSRDKIRAILTPEQGKKYEERQKERRGRRGRGRRRPGSGGRPGPP